MAALDAGARGVSRGKRQLLVPQGRLGGRRSPHVGKMPLREQFIPSLLDGGFSSGEMDDCGAAALAQTPLAPRNWKTACVVSLKQDASPVLSTVEAFLDEDIRWYSEGDVKGGADACDVPFVDG